MNYFALTEEEFKDVYDWIQMYIKYRRTFYQNYPPLRYVFFKFGSKQNVVDKWQDEKFWEQDFDKLYEYIDEKSVFSISQTLLPNEIVLEADKDYTLNLAKIIAHYLKLYNLKAIPIFSGGSSVHFHILFNRALSREERKKIFDVFKVRINNLDEHGIYENHPFRVPGSYHPESHKKCTIIQVSSLDYISDLINKIQKDKDVQILSNFENNVDEFLSKFNFNTNNNIKKKREDIVITHEKSRVADSFLQKAFDELLNLQIEDGRYRVLILITCLAKKLQIQPDEFEKIITNWAEKIGWRRESFIRNWIKYYKEAFENQVTKEDCEKYIKEKMADKERLWMNCFVFRLSWALKYFEETKNDIKDEDREKIEEIIKKYFGQIYEKIVNKNV